MTQDQFCDGIRLLGGPQRAADAIGINKRAIERIMTGTETLGDTLAQRLAAAIGDLELRCREWSVQPGLINAA